MANNEISFYGTWKGEIINVIVNYGAKTWEDFAELTDIPTNRINQVLKELFRYDAIYKRYGTDEYGTSETIYRVPKDIWDEYKALNNSKNKVRRKTREDNAIIIDKDLARTQIVNILAKDQETVEAILLDDHFFVSDGKLTSVIQKLIELSKVSIQILNPYIRCLRNLVNRLRYGRLISI